ncbi:MAG: hypothetical protein WA129_08520 [Acidovorax sp.]
MNLVGWVRTEIEAASVPFAYVVDFIEVGFDKLQSCKIFRRFMGPVIAASLPGEDFARRGQTAAAVAQRSSAGIPQPAPNCY